MAGRHGVLSRQLRSISDLLGGNNVIMGPALQSADPPQYVLLLNADTIVRPGALTGSH